MLESFESMSAINNFTITHIKVSQEFIGYVFTITISLNELVINLSFGSEYNIES